MVMNICYIGNLTGPGDEHLLGNLTGSGNEHLLGNLTGSWL